MKQTRGHWQQKRMLRRGLVDQRCNLTYRQLWLVDNIVCLSDCLRRNASQQDCVDSIVHMRVRQFIGTSPNQKSNLAKLDKGAWDRTTATPIEDSQAQYCHREVTI